MRSAVWSEARSRAVETPQGPSPRSQAARPGSTCPWHRLTSHAVPRLSPETPDQSSGPPRSASLRVLDLFAGAGGLTRAFHDIEGFSTVRAVESDKAAAATFAANFGDEVYAGKIEDWLHEEDVPAVDIVVGGPPCQGFSRLGKQDVNDERNELWREYAETVARANPSFFLVENVGAFLESPQYSLLQQATAKKGLLSQYRLHAAVLNSADYGAPQARRRTVVIGSHRDLEAPGLPAPTHIGRHVSVRSALKRVTPKVTKTDLPDRSTDFRGTTFPGSFRTKELHLNRNYTSLSKARFRCIPAGGNRFDIPDDLLADCWRKHRSGSADVMGRLHWDKPSVTIRTEFFKPEKGRYLHPVENRALTHYEAALLQGFPGDFRWVGSKTAIARQIGNAVPIALGRALATHLLAQFESR
ncbi:DNA cytosine methyltransferase [Kribbella sp. NPDC056345]|uniref:DNA cytosine methyltransferase n=1 Tax=Kribbella sp. NPDC056345 TaxID=3345789 RepID=UPI0035D74A77